MREAGAIPIGTGSWRIHSESDCLRFVGDEGSEVGGVVEGDKLDEEELDISHTLRRPGSKGQLFSL
jgi:hypothetical protein